MQDSRLPHKFLNAWIPNQSRKAGGQQKSIRSTSITALKSVIPVKDNWKGQFGDFYSKLKDVADWDELLHDRLRHPPRETEFRCPGEQHQIHHEILEQRAKHIRTQMQNTIV
jgi:hypothetical protein